MVDAGCKTRTMKSISGLTGKQWVSVLNGKGKLLANGACIGDSYTKNVVPEKGITKIYTEIAKQTVRSVDSKGGTLSVEFAITMAWQDPRIKTKFSEPDMVNGQIVLSKEAIDEIWTPDLYILNRKSFDSMQRWAFLKSAHILTTSTYMLQAAGRRNQTLPAMQITYDIKSTVYCDFQHSSYPLDTQFCQVGMGSSSHGAIFVLFNHESNSNGSAMHLSTDFNISMTLFDHQSNLGSNIIGIKIKMARKLSSFLLQYYIPCVAIALISQLSFVIPVTAIPGRVSLLVTLFLTLVNLFIHEMVSILDNLTRFFL